MQNLNVFSLRQPLFWAILILWAACKPGASEAPPAGSALFTEMPADYTGVDFENRLKYDRQFNIYTYRNFYNGGGVAAGDLNGDGLPDLFFTSNMAENRLYLNRGGLRFEDITRKAGVAGTRAWSTGVSFADVNGDGWLDIYVCNSGDIAGDNKENELYINQGAGEDGVPTFREMAAGYGLADPGFSTHAAFFDYDKDGDLDLYLLNNSYRAIGSFDLRKNERNKRDPLGGHKLYRNDGQKFSDVSETAGIYGSIIGFGLGVTVGDINLDGWQDIYVSNDFFERDYLYLNQGDGSFREALEEGFRSISAASMGADMADVNNDLWPDVFVTDMLPEPDARIKQVTTFEGWDRYQLGLENGYWHQFTRNMLHLNGGLAPPLASRKPPGVFFYEVSRFCQVEATDWSWGALIFDMDNDGLKDIFVANGVYQDLTDQDYLSFIANSETQRQLITRQGVDYKTLIDSIPSRPQPNYAFHNQGLRGPYRIPEFNNRAAEWGLGKPGFSNGSAYADLDNDGDLDLIVNNINATANIYRNEAAQRKNANWLQFRLKGEGKNPFALGTKVILRHQGRQFYLEQMPMRGFQSTVDERLHFGLGDIQQLDSVMVYWPDGRYTLLQKVAVNQVLTLSIQDAQPDAPPLIQQPDAQPLLGPEAIELPAVHKENYFVDFNRDRLLYHMLSTEGPKLSTGDVNGDGREDLYFGGAKDQPGMLLLQQADGSFKPDPQAVFEADKSSEDMGSTFFDADGDGDLDLFVCSGGYELPPSSSALASRLYLNNGKGKFSRSAQRLPDGRYESASCVQAADVDRDGDPDLFVGLRLKSFDYGRPVSGYLLLNDGRGNFSNATGRLAPELNEIGMMTDARWLDMDGDGDSDLVIAGEWMAVEVFENQNGSLKRVTQAAGLAQSAGWWNCLEVADLDGDGDPDLVLGNHGLNSRFRTRPDAPMTLYVEDFDGNGTAEQILARPVEGRMLPFARQHDMVSQMPGLRKRYLRFNTYSHQDMQAIFGAEALQKAQKMEAHTFASCIALNDGKGHFSLKTLPAEAQLSCIYGIAVADFDGDKHNDLLLGGNFDRAKPEAGRYDANYGLLLKGDGKGGFAALTPQQSGLWIAGEVRDFALIRSGRRRNLIVARNNLPALMIPLNR